MAATTTQRQSIQEFVDSRDQSLRVDRHASVLRGVKLLGLSSRNNRVYREHALRRAMPLYEGARVNVNHPAGDPLAPRDYRDRMGVIRGVELRPGEGLFGALHFNPRHPLAEQLAWDAEHAPENVGLSHNVLAHTAREGERVIVESIEHVQSVDLVADPATTSGLFEHAEPMAQADDASAQLDQLRRERDDARHSARVYKLLAEHGLRPGTSDREAGAAVSEAFVQALLVTRDQAALEQLVADRAALLQESGRESFGEMTLAREQQPLSSAPPSGSGGFVAAITRR